jgi:hypothetical protein
MPNRPNINKDRFFLSLIQQRKLVCTPDGQIWNVKTRNKIGTVNGSGYVAVSWKDPGDGKIKVILAQRLIWLFFKGPIPDDLVVNHKDGTKANNHIDNLELLTELENREHALETGLHVIGERSPFAKLTEKDVRKVLLEPQEKTHSEIAKTYGVSSSAISQIRRGLRWRHIKI